MSTEKTNPTLPAPGERYTVNIESLAAGGDGVAHLEGLAVFIPNSTPGDTVEIEIVQSARNFARGRITALLQPGPDRIPTPCPLAAGCPGCQLQQLAYGAQLKAKEQFVRDALERIGRLKGIEVQPVRGMHDPWSYRNKGEFAADTTGGAVRLGYRSDTGAFLPLPECPIQHPLSMRILRAVEDVATRESLPLAQLITRISPHQNKALAILVCWDWSERLPIAAILLQERIPELTGILWSRVRGKSLVRRTLAEPLAGRSSLIQRLNDREYTVSAESFFQVNNVQAEYLLGQAASWAGNLKDCDFLDGFCGVGTFLLPLAGRAHRALGIEEHPIAMQDAEVNLARYALHRVRLYQGRVDTIFSRLLRKGRKVDVALLDPPRKGAGPQVLGQLPELGVKRVILVSCDPATLGRDAGDLWNLGYRVQAVQPVDMFPQTWHVETVALAVKD